MTTSTLLFALGCAELKTDTETDLEAVTVNIAGTVTTILGAQPHEGVEVCNAETNNCAFTDEVGLYSILAIANSETHARAVLDEHRSAIIPFQTEESPKTLPPISLSPNAVVSALFSTALLEEDSNMGMIAFSISNGILGDGINTPNIVASSAHETAVVVYTAENGLPNRDLVETSINGGGIVVNVPPGTATIEFDGLAGNCTRLLGYGQPSALRTPVVAGEVSLIRIECAQ